MWKTSQSGSRLDEQGQRLFLVAVGQFALAGLGLEDRPPGQEVEAPVLLRSESPGGLELGAALVPSLLQRQVPRQGDADRVFEVL